QNVEGGIGRQKLFVECQLEQRGFELVRRLIRQDLLDLGLSGQLLGGGGGGAHKEAVVGNVSDDGSAGLLEERAKSIIKRGAGLHEVTARITFGTQMVGDAQGDRLGGIYQGVFEQDGFVTANKLAEREGAVGEDVRSNSWCV